MSDEEKVTTEPKKKSWPIVIAVLAVIIIAVCIGFLHWHEQPSFCSTMCHATMQKYVDGYESEDPGLLVATHAENDVTCLGCHWSQAKMLDLVHEVVLFVSDGFTDPLPDNKQFVNDEFCGACHDGKTAPTKEAATADWAIDPHNYDKAASSMHPEVACGDCHSVHKGSTLVCASCHDEIDVPEGWLVAANVAKDNTALSFLAYDPHAYDQSLTSLHTDIACADCHDTKTFVCASCHEGTFIAENMPEGWTLAEPNATKAAASEAYGVFGMFHNEDFIASHMTGFTCDSCHATKTMACGQCHANSFAELPEGWVMPEGAMDLFAPAADEAEEPEAAPVTGDLADGEYVGSGKGIGGSFDVTVVVKDGKVAEVTVGDNSETAGIGTKAIEELPELIIEANGTEGVEAVSGASITSKAIFTAVNDALAKAAK